MSRDEIQLRFFRYKEKRFINEEIPSLRHYLHSNNNKTVHKCTVAYINSSDHHQNNAIKFCKRTRKKGLIILCQRTNECKGQILYDLTQMLAWNKNNNALKF